VPAESIARWISQNSPQHEPKVVRPYDYTNLLIGIGATAAALAILKLSFSTLKPAIYSRNLWAAVSLVLILLFTSGHMFNHIRRVPYVVNNGKGGISYIAGGFQNQFGLETQIIAVVCMCYHLRVAAAAGVKWAGLINWAL
jgi:oligosaccharyltransferase complex subunit gamma